MCPNVQTIWLELPRNHSKNILIGGVYRQWNKPDTYFDTILKKFQQATNSKLPLLIMGDIDLDMLKWREKEYKVKNVADKWRSVLGQPGLKNNYLGITYISHYIKNGDHYKSGLDHIYFNPEKIVKNWKSLRIAYLTTGQ